MGKTYFDYWTLHHFGLGFLSIYAFQEYLKNRIFLILFLILVNIIHDYLEKLEKERCPLQNKVLETEKNHIGDNVSFLIGSLMASYFVYKTGPVRIQYEYSFLLRFLVFYGIFRQSARELYPYADNLFFKGAFTEGCN